MTKYDALGNFMGGINYCWNSDSMAWINDDKYTAEYDSVGNMIKAEISEWDSVASKWYVEYANTMTWTNLDSNSIKSFSQDDIANNNLFVTTIQLGSSLIFDIKNQESAIKITILSLAGKQILQKNISNSETTTTANIDISKLSCGIYFYSVKMDESRFLKRFTILK